MVHGWIYDEKQYDLSESIGKKSYNELIDLIIQKSCALSEPNSEINFPYVSQG